MNVLWVYSRVVGSSFEVERYLRLEFVIVRVIEHCWLYRGFEIASVSFVSLLAFGVLGCRLVYICERF